MLVIELREFKAKKNNMGKLFLAKFFVFLTEIFFTYLIKSECKNFSNVCGENTKTIAIHIAS